MSSRPKQRSCVRIIVQEWENGTYSATENGVNAKGVGGTAHEAVRDYTRQVEGL